ncbi:hypothetical protein ACOMHN_049815 [Nucella lapillus]
MPSLRRIRGSTTGLFKNCLKTVPVPVFVCVLILTVVVMVDLEVRKLSNRVDESSESGGVPTDVKEDRGNLKAAEARIDAALAEVPGVAARAEPPLPGYPQQPARAAEPLLSPSGPDQHSANGEDISEGEVEALAQILDMRIAQASGGVIGTRNCSTLAAMNNTRGTCIDTTCQHRFHPSAKTRIRQLLTPRFRVTSQQLDLINALAKGVVPKKYMFVTAASSNHYNESQALVHNMRQFIFNKLPPSSYSFLYYDLGLKPWERRRVEKNCNCTVVSINKKAFPKHTHHLMCYAWKPFIIKALLPKTEVLVYMDTSVRFRNMDLQDFFDTARRWGAQFLASMDSIPNHTVQSMFDFYQNPACLFWPFPELLAGFSVFHNEPFMTRVVLDPWVSCAYNEKCMCPVDPHAFRNCPHVERRVGMCHRFDLSSLTLQMAKLYGNKFGHLVIQDKNRPKIVRNDRMDFFTD